MITELVVALLFLLGVLMTADMIETVSELRLRHGWYCLVWPLTWAVWFIILSWAMARWFLRREPEPFPRVRVVRHQ